MRKKVTMGAKPQGTTPPAAMDEWVSGGQTGVATAISPPQNEENAAESTEDMKRLTIDVPETLHRRIKRTCADRGLKMADQIRLLLEHHFLED